MSLAKKAFPLTEKIFFLENKDCIYIIIASMEGVRKCVLDKAQVLAK